MDATTPLVVNDTTTPQPPTKVFRGRTRLGFTNPLPPRVLFGDSDTEEDDSNDSYSSGDGSDLWEVTCPRCGCHFTASETLNVEEVDSRSTLGTSSRLAIPVEVLPEGRNTRGRTVDDGRRNPIPTGTTDGLIGSNFAYPIRIEDD